MVAIGLIVPGGFGVKPPQWFHDRPPQDVASVSSVNADRRQTHQHLLLTAREWHDKGRR